MRKTPQFASDYRFFSCLFGVPSSTGAVSVRSLCHFGTNTAQRAAKFLNAACAVTPLLIGACQSRWGLKLPMLVTWPFGRGGGCGCGALVEGDDEGFGLWMFDGLVDQGRISDIELREPYWGYPGHAANHCCGQKKFLTILVAKTIHQKASTKQFHLKTIINSWRTQTLIMISKNRSLFQSVYKTIQIKNNTYYPFYIINLNVTFEHF